MRYLPLKNDERQEMLKAIGVSNVKDLFKDVPDSANLTKAVNLPFHMSEQEVSRTLGQMADKNMTAASGPFFIGAGAYRHHVPSSVDHLIQRGEFLTSYTPYQPEITQGTLQYLFEFQTQVAAITGMEVANASLYDGSTACNEAVLMANRQTKRKKAVLSGGLHPHYADLVKSQASFSDFSVVQPKADIEGSEDLSSLIADDVSCVVVQYPSFFGHVRDYTSLADACHAKGVLFVVIVTEIVSLGLLKSPGEMGADIVAAEGQSIGNTLNFGGPYVGLFACRESFIRQMPGRLCGQTVDADGKRGFVLTLSTREQHIRREKATSNICTNAGLCALSFNIHMSLLGEVGYRHLAELNHAKAVQLSEKLAKVKGVSVLNNAFFNEFSVRLTKPAADVVSALAKKNILGGVPASRLLPHEADAKNILVLAATELNNDDDMDKLANALGEILS